MRIVVAIDRETDGEKYRAPLPTPCKIFPIGFEIADEDTRESDGISFLFESSFELSVVLIDESEFRHPFRDALNEK